MADKLAENIAIGGNGWPESMRILHKVGQRYINKVVKGTECRCQYSGQNEKMTHHDGQIVVDHVAKSTVFGGGEIKSTKGCGWWVVALFILVHVTLVVRSLMQDDENKPSKYKISLICVKPRTYL